jgi:XTP/dITP diphosphohydrolase
VEDVEQVRQNWEQIKAQEKGENPATAQLLSHRLRRYGRTLPPLMATSKISHQAASAGLEWERVEGVWAKFEEELAEFKESLQSNDKNHQKSELGDLLFTLVNIARWYDLDPSSALQETNQRFIQRLAKVESLADKELKEHSLDELEALWQEAKAQLNKSEDNS